MKCSAKERLEELAESLELDQLVADLADPAKHEFKDWSNFESCDGLCFTCGHPEEDHR